MESQFTLDNMISNPDILMTAVNETFGTDFQHKYYTPNTPTNSVYMTQPQPQPSQMQQKARSQAIEVLVKELGELKTRVKKLEEDSRQQKPSAIEIPPIQIPIRLNILDAEPQQVSTPTVGLGHGSKKITLSKRKR